MERRIMKKISIIFIVIFVYFSAFAKIPSGYQGNPWGTSLSKIKAKYSGLSKYKDSIYNLKNYKAYGHYNPTTSIRFRIFYFFNNRLASVKIEYNYGVNQLDKLKKISKALLDDFGQTKVRSYRSQKYGRVLQHITWKGNGTKVTWFLSQSGTPQVPTGQTNYLYFESLKYQRKIARAYRTYKQNVQKRRQKQKRQERGY
jgi:hypothetical protein